MYMSFLYISSDIEMVYACKICMPFWTFSNSDIAITDRLDTCVLISMVPKTLIKVRSIDLIIHSLIMKLFRRHLNTTESFLATFLNWRYQILDAYSNCCVAEQFSWNKRKHRIVYKQMLVIGSAIAVDISCRKSIVNLQHLINHPFSRYTRFNRHMLCTLHLLF